MCTMTLNGNFQILWWHVARSRPLPVVAVAAASDMIARRHNYRKDPGVPEGMAERDERIVPSRSRTFRHVARPLSPRDRLLPGRRRRGDARARRGPLRRGPRRREGGPHHRGHEGEFRLGSHVASATVHARDTLSKAGSAAYT